MSRNGKYEMGAPADASTGAITGDGAGDGESA